MANKKAEKKEFEPPAPAMNKAQLEAQAERERRQSEAARLKQQRYDESQGWETVTDFKKSKPTNIARSRKDK